jgi:hypothetical protein
MFLNSDENVLLSKRSTRYFQRCLNEAQIERRMRKLSHSEVLAKQGKRLTGMTRGITRR